MQRINQWLHSKPSVVTTVIPGLNILYILFAFVTLPLRKNQLRLKIFLAFLGCALICAVLPQQWRFLAIYAAVVAIAVLFWRIGIHETYGAERGTAFWCRLAFVAAIVIGVAVFLMILSSGKNVQAVEHVMTVISEDNSEEWENLIHPQCNAAIRSLSAYKKSLHEQQIEVAGAVEKVRVTEYHVTATGAKKETVLRAYVTVGETRYEVLLRFYKTRDGEGLQDISLLPA